MPKKIYSACVRVVLLSSLLMATDRLGRSAPLVSDPVSRSSTRVSLAYFERPLAVQWSLADGVVSQAQTSWNETALPAPAADPSLGAPIASFTDSLGCLDFGDQASLAGQAGPRLCFKVMGDVSNLGLNDREMAFTPGASDDSDSRSHGSLNDCVANPDASELPPTSYRVQNVSFTHEVLTLRLNDACDPSAQTAAMVVIRPL